MTSASDLASASKYQLEEGGVWSSIGGSCGKCWPRDPVPLLYRLHRRHQLTLPRTQRQGKKTVLMIWTEEVHMNDPWTQFC